MDLKEKLSLLKSLRLFARVPQEHLSTLAEFLEPLRAKEGGVLFEEGSHGDSLYFISSGHIRIQKRVVQADGSQGFNDLAILGPGDCFGEMALFDEESPRSAQASASGDAVLFRLERKKLLAWLELNPSLAVGFFNELVSVLTRRLRRASNEMTLLFDLSRWLLEPTSSAKELLREVLQHLVPHLEGEWSAAAHLYNEFNNELEAVATIGPSSTESRLPESLPTADNVWLDPQNFLVRLPGPQRAKGYLLFTHVSPLEEEERNEISRALTTAGRLVASALTHLDHRIEDEMRSRLTATRQFHASGL